MSDSRDATTQAFYAHCDTPSCMPPDSPGGVEFSDERPQHTCTHSAGSPELAGMVMRQYFAQECLVTHPLYCHELGSICVRMRVSPGYGRGLSSWGKWAVPRIRNQEWN